MLSQVPPATQDPALADAPTRRALCRYAARHLLLFVGGLALLFVGSLTLDDAGDARPGIPFAVPFIMIFPGLVAALLGALGLVNAARMTWVLSRRPWRSVQVRFEELQMGTPNGQPVLHLASPDQRWTLTLAALHWRWRRFGEGPTLLLAARPGRGGVVATPDRASLAWAGRSVATAFLLRLRGRRHRR